MRGLVSSQCERAGALLGERQNHIYQKDVAIPKESDLGQVGLQRRQICLRSASFSMVDGKWLSGRCIGNSFPAARLIAYSW